MIGIMADQEEYTVDEVAKRLRIHRDTVIRRIEAKLIVARKEGRGWRVSKEDLEAYIRSTYPQERSE